MATTFSVGDTVKYQDGAMGAAVTCVVTKVMPQEGHTRTYRIQDSNERFERAVPGFTLTLVAPIAAESAFKSGRAKG